MITHLIDGKAVATRPVAAQPGDEFRVDYGPLDAITFSFV
jgi:2-keto-4-pentenoate hydratase